VAARTERAAGACYNLVMSVYLVVNDNVKDMALLGEYYKGAGPTAGPHGGKAIVVEHAAETLEGTPKGSRVVVMEFPDREAAMAWYNSDAYQAVIGKRHAATENGFMLLVNGMG
jgi:uncharacterized protein (DUF1330 family)